MKKNRKMVKELKFYCEEIEQKNPTELIEEFKKIFLDDYVELFDRYLRGEMFAACRDWYPTMPYSYGVNFFLTAIDMNKDERASTIKLFDWSLKKFFGKRNIFTNLNFVSEFIKTHGKDIRNKCGKKAKIALFFLDADLDPKRILLIAEKRKWSLSQDDVGVVDTIWDDIKQNKVFFLSNDKIPEWFHRLIPK